MKRIFFGALILIAWASASSLALVQSNHILVFTHVKLIDGTGSPVQPDMTVTIRDHEIVEVSESARIPPNAQLIEARGKYLIPGLWDMHVHEIFGDWLPEDDKITPLLFVANGITGVRDMGGDLGQLKRWRARIASGEMIGPRMFIGWADSPIP